MQIEAPEKNLIKIEKLASEIDDKFSQATRFAAESVRNGHAAIIAAIECGKMLIKAKAIIGHGSWLNWLADNTKVSADTSQRWMRLAKTARLRNLTEECNSLADAYRACGILPYPTKANNGTGTHEVDIYEAFNSNFSRLTGRAKELISDFDLSGLPIETKEKIREELKPIVEFYQGL